MVVVVVVCSGVVFKSLLNSLRHRKDDSCMLPVMVVTLVRLLIRLLWNFPHAASLFDGAYLVAFEGRHLVINCSCSHNCGTENNEKKGEI